MFVKLTDESGDPIWVNVAEIKSIRPGSAMPPDDRWRATLHTAGGIIIVRETPEEILAKIKEGEGK